MADLQVANAGTVETKTGFLVPPITINIVGWDDLTGKTTRLEIYSRHGTLLFELTSGEDQLSVTAAQVVISPASDPVGSDTAKTSGSQAKFATWSEMPAGLHKAILRVLPSGEDAEIGLSFDWRHRSLHDTAAVATALVTSLTVEDSGGAEVAVSVVVGGLTVGSFDALPPLASVDPDQDRLALRDADGGLVGTALPSALGLAGAYTVLERTTNDGTTISGIGQQTIYARVIDGGTLGASNGLLLRLRLEVTGGQGVATDTDVVFGGATVFSGIVLLIVRTGSTYVVDLLVLVGATGATSQYWNVHMQGIRSTQVAAELGGDFATSAVDSAQDQTLTVTFNPSHASNSVTVRLVELFKFEEV